MTPTARRTYVTAALALALAAPVAASSETHVHSLEQDGYEREREQAHERVRWQDARASNPRAWVRFQVLGINDFHGQLGAGRTVGGRPVGSAAVLAAYLKAAQDDGDNGGTFIVHAGDHVGASPPVSALLQDEPSIDFLNLLANDQCTYAKPLHPACNLVGTLGNHEFDEGAAEMQRLVRGGNHADGPFLEDPYRGARFPYVSANVIDAGSGRPILPPYVIKRVRGLPVAFIGAVLKETPTIVTPTGVAGVRFLDEADAINRYAAELKRKRVRAIVVLIHQGTRTATFTGPTPSEPVALDGAIGDIVSRLDDEIDVVVSGHAHSFTNALVANANGKPILVTQAFASGTAYADIDLAIDPASRDIVEKSAAVVTTWADAGPGLVPDARVAELVAGAEARVAPLVNRILGIAATAITRTTSGAGESALGDLIADAQRAAMGADFAFMNPGGIRADLDAGDVTWGELFTVQPFGNDLVAMDLTGAQVVRLLNQQWAGQPFPRILQISGLSYTWDNARPAADRVVEVRDGAGNTLDLTATYRVAVNSFIAAGGDNFTVLTEGTNRVIGPVDLDALVAYVPTLPQPFAAAIGGRIQRLN